MRILIGNALSLTAAIFMSLASASSQRRLIFLFQMLDCLFLAVAQLFFGVPSGAVALFIGVIRNTVILKGLYTGPVMLIFALSTLTLGIAINTSGILGIIPVIATLVLTVGSYACCSRVALKFTMLVNLMLWASYSYFISDYATAFANSVSAAICIVTLSFRRHHRPSGKRSNGRK